MQEKEILNAILQEYFRGYKYKDAIHKIKEKLDRDSKFAENWIDISDVIRKNEFEKEEAFNLVAFAANLPLDEDTDEEACKWLNLLVDNVEKMNESEIVEY